MKLERSTAFQGFVVVDDHVVIGAVQFCRTNSPAGDVFYAHSFWSHGPSQVAAMLWQATRKEARKGGFQTIDFYVSPDQPALMRLTRTGKAKVRQIWMEVKA